MGVLSEHIEHSTRFMKTPDANYLKRADNRKSQVICFWYEQDRPQGHKQTTNTLLQPSVRCTVALKTAHSTL